MRRLIVNADDLGFTSGINRGIVEAHERGIVTSASLMVDRPAAAEGGAIARRTPALSVGLHAVLDHHEELTVAPADCRDELSRQLARFEELVGAPPTHIDSHHHVHRDERIHVAFAEFADEHRLPMRERTVPHCPDYYGASAIGVDNLLELLSRLEEGDSELGCHPGYADGLVSRYTLEREDELRALTDPRVRASLADFEIELIGWREL